MSIPFPLIKKACVLSILPKTFEKADKIREKTGFIPNLYSHRAIVISAYNLILILYNLLEEKPLQLIGIVKEVRMVQITRPGRLGSEKYPI